MRQTTTIDIDAIANLSHKHGAENAVKDLPPPGGLPAEVCAYVEPLDSRR